MRKERNDSIFRPRVWTSINESQETSIHLFHSWLDISDGGYASLACSERSFKPFPRKIAINSYFILWSSRKSLFMVTTNHWYPVAMNREYLCHSAEKALEVRQSVWGGVEIYHCISWKWWKSVRKCQEVLILLNKVLIVCVCSLSAEESAPQAARLWMALSWVEILISDMSDNFIEEQTNQFGIRNLKGIWVISLRE